MKQTIALCAVLLAISCTQTQSHESSRPFAEFRGDPGVARAAVSDWIKRGEAAIPELKSGLEEDSTKVQRYCTEALAKITGQWGWNNSLLWERSLTEATKLGKPMMVLHLFGNFDEEFC